MPKKGNDKPDAPKKERTAAQAAMNQERRKAAEELKARGIPYSLKLAAALIAHRRAGKPDDEFFAALPPAAVIAANLATGAAAGAAAANAAAKPKKNTTAKAKKSKAAAANAANLASGAAAAAERSGHSEAGLKAKNSEKGAAWLSEVDAAHANLKSNFVKVGLATKPRRRNAMRLASTRRNSPARAENVRMNIIAEAQGKVFQNENDKKGKKPYNPFSNTRRNKKPGGNNSPNPFNAF